MAKKHPLSNGEYENLAAFRYELRKFLQFSENAAKSAGLTPTHHQALLAIRGFPGRAHVSVGELAERLQIRHHSAVGLVDRLVLQGVVERFSSSEDRRQVHVKLTRSGEEKLEELSTVHREQLRRIGPELRGLLRSFDPGEEFHEL